MPDSGEALDEHSFCVISRPKLPCSYVESFSPNSRVGTSQNYMARWFSISEMHREKSELYLNHDREQRTLGQWKEAQNLVEEDDDRPSSQK